MEDFTVGLGPVRIHLYKMIKDKSYRMQCDSPTDFEDFGFIYINCALDKCESCGAYPWPTTEEELEEEDQKLWFHTYETLPTCTKQ